MHPFCTPRKLMRAVLWLTELEFQLELFWSYSVSTAFMRVIGKGRRSSKCCCDSKLENKSSRLKRQSKLSQKRLPQVGSKTILSKVLVLKTKLKILLSTHMNKEWCWKLQFCRSKCRKERYRVKLRTEIN